MGIKRRFRCKGCGTEYLVTVHRNGSQLGNFPLPEYSNTQSLSRGFMRCMLEGQGANKSRSFESRIGNDT